MPWNTNNQSYKKIYIYDALNQLTWYDDTFGNYYAYAYDKAGNIINEEYVNPQDQYSVKLYSYDNANWRDLLTSYNGESIVYDAIGNPTVYRGANLTWSEGRRLATYSKNGQLLSFQYDADGKRISKNVNGTVYNYIYNQGSLVGISNNNGILLKFICDEKGDYVGFIQGGLTYYYVRNLQNDVVGISDTSGNVLVTYTYDPWGKVASVTGNTYIGNANPIRYRGYFYDSETGLYYLQSRYYDPETNRFINADGVIAGVGGDILGCNQYAYCFNNPINMEDPNGNWAEFLEQIGTNICQTIISFARTCISPLKAISVEVGAGIGVGAKGKLYLKNVPVEIGAVASITDSITYQNESLDFRNTSSVNMGVNLAKVFDFSYKTGYSHSYFDSGCTCGFGACSYNEKTNCPANDIFSSNEASIGFSIGAYLIFGGEVSVCVDFKAWNDELMDIYNDHISTMEEVGWYY